MNEDQTVINTRDEEVMDALRENEQVYVAGVRYDVAGYSIAPGPDGNGEVMVAALDRTFKNSIKRCQNCKQGEKIQVEDDRFASGYRWECNYCSWKQEA